MNRVSSIILATLLALVVASAALSAEIRLKDGRTWRGEVSDQVAVTFVENGVEVTLEGRLKTIESLYLVLETTIAGAPRDKVIYRGDIETMRSLTDAAEDAAARSEERANEADSQDARRTTGAKASSMKDDVPRSPDGRELGVFVLPLEGMVGIFIRHNEIKMLGEYIDENYGPGQTIVLIINSNGGLVAESDVINETIWELKKRHRVVAWVEKAVSAGCTTAMCCDEIYFTTEGIAGSVTSILMTGGGPVAVEEQQQLQATEKLVDVAEKSGYSEHIARAMKMRRYMVSYDKDPETGEVTWYGDLSGEFVLSDENSNLNFNSSNAVHSGFAKGIADTEEELAELLDLPKWHEISDYGREIAEDWTELVERCQKEVPMLVRRKGYLNSSSNQQVRLGTIIRLNEELIRWWERCEIPMGLMGMAPPKEYLERENEELRRQLAQLRGRR